MITTTEKQTITAGKRFSKKLKGGEVVLLIGDLGAGKTTFVKGVAQGLGVKSNITSPTFVLMKVYSGKKKLVHIDTYRGLDLAGLQDIGAIEYFGQPDTVCFVEWGSGLEKYLHKKKIRFYIITLENIDEHMREIDIN